MLATTDAEIGPRPSRSSRRVIAVDRKAARNVPALARCAGSCIGGSVLRALRQVGDRARDAHVLGDRKHKDEGRRSLSMGEGAKLATQITKQIDGMTATLRKSLDETKVEAENTYTHARQVLLGTVALALLIAVAGAIWMSLSISRGLSSAVTMAGAIADGDLTQQLKVTSNDEIKDLADALNSMVEKLQDRGRELLSASDNVSSGSQELSAGAEQLSAGASEQAASAQEASSSMEQMAANIKQNADNAAQTEKIARQSARRRAGERRRGQPRGSGHADDRREDHHRAGDRPADRSSGAQRRGRGGPCRRARQGLRGGRLRGAQARRAQPDGGRRNRHAVRRDREGRAGGGRDAGEARAGHQEDRRAGRRDQRRLPRAGRRARIRSTRRSSSSTR